MDPAKFLNISTAQIGHILDHRSIHPERSGRRMKLVVNRSAETQAYP